MEPNNQNQQDQQNNQIATEIPAVIGDLASKFSGLSGLVKPETLAQLKEVGDKKMEAAAAVTGGNSQDPNQSAQSEQNSSQQGTEQLEGQQEQAGSQTQEGQQESSQENAGKSDEETVISVIGAKIGGKKEKKPGIVIEKYEDLLPAIKSKYGQELKEVKDLPKFLESVDKWRSEAQKLKEVEQSASEYKKVLEGIPDDLLSDIRNFYSGIDYKKERANAPAISFKLDADKQDKKALVNQYFKDKLTEGQIEKIGTDEEDQATKITVEASISQYKVDKQKHDEAIAARENSAKDSVRKFGESIEGSMTHLKTTFPGLDAVAEAKVKQIMTGGMRGVIARYFNEDGTFKQDAAERLLLAENGRDVISELMSHAERRAETKVNEEVVTRGANGADKHANRGGSSISPEAQRTLDELKKLNKKVTV